MSILRFPPFPAPPDGVKIVQFKAFKESGIQMFATAANDEEVEIDGRGIPTIPLRVKHDTDECKSNAKRKREKKKKAGDQERDSTRGGRKLDWWEQWEETENLRVFTYDPNLSRVDRVFQAAHDFKANRTWPPAPIGIQAIWDQFRVFTGLLSNTPVWRKGGGDKHPGPAADDDDDDTFSDEEVTHTANDSSLPKVTPTELDSGMDDDAIDQKEDKLEAFLNDPEQAIKIFLGSFMRKQGLIWSDRNLTATPALISFFLRFLQQNRALPEPTHVRGLRNALAVVDLAAKELPLTAKIARALPDAFHKGCVACWGERVDGYKTLGVREVVVETKEEEERDSKRRKVDGDGASAPGLGFGMATEVDAEAKARFEAELNAANVKILKLGEDIVMETLNVKTGGAKEDNQSNKDGGAWGGGEGWGGSAGWGECEGWGDDGDAVGGAASSWEPTRNALTTFLGPTMFPLTHAPGVVELSVRRIKEILAVGAGKEGGGEQARGPAEAVEAELEGMFAKVVLEPWPGWNADEEVNMSKPRILDSSRGAVVSASGATEVAPEMEGAGGARPHDPANDDIVVLVEPGVVETLRLGMGLGATWVQLVRQEQGDVVAKKGKKGKGKKEKAGTKAVDKYWYVEEVTMILPSYYK